MSSPHQLVIAHDVGPIKIEASRLPFFMSVFMVPVVAFGAYKIYDTGIVGSLSIALTTAALIIMLSASFIYSFKTKYFITEHEVVAWMFYPVSILSDIKTLLYELRTDKTLDEQERYDIEQDVSELEGLVDKKTKHIVGISLENIDYIYVQQGLFWSIRRFGGYGNVVLCHNIYKAPDLIMRSVINPKAIVKQLNAMILKIKNDKNSNR